MLRCLALGLALVLVAAACGDDDADEQEAEEAGAEAVVPLGAMAQAGDWGVTVAATAPDATDAILEADPSVEAPAEGEVFYMLTIELLNQTEAPLSPSSLMFSVTGDSAEIYESAAQAACGSIPEALDVDSEVDSEATLTGNLCWSVRSDDVDSLRLVVEGAGGPPALLSLT